MREHFTEHANRCDLCRSYPVELRPICVVRREEIPLLCSGCTLILESAGRLDLARDAEVFGYA